MNHSAPEQVDNPLVGDLESLRSDVIAAVDACPTLDGPFSHIGGTDSAWTGTEADRVARERLDPLAAELGAALTRMAEVIDETLEATPDGVDEPGYPAPDIV